MFHPKPGGLRNPGDRFWHDILQQSKAKIHAKNNTFAALSPGSNPGLLTFDPLFSGSLFQGFFPQFNVGGCASSTVCWRIEYSGIQQNTRPVIDGSNMNSPG